jgi:aspartate 1-decarboxylase
MCKSKIHRATVTGTNLNYCGSITIDKELMKAADILQYEMVMVVNVNNGERFETYVMQGKEGEISINGAAARLSQPGDLVIIISSEMWSDDELMMMSTAGTYLPKIVQVDSENKIIR